MNVKPGGYLVVGLSEDETEIIVNHPDLIADPKRPGGYIVFSPDEAVNLALLLIKKAGQCKAP